MGSKLTCHFNFIRTGRSLEQELAVAPSFVLFLNSECYRSRMSRDNTRIRPLRMLPTRHSLSIGLILR